MRRRRMRKRGMRCLSLFLGIAMLMSGCARAEDPVQNAENRGATPAPAGGERVNRITPTSEIQELEEGLSAVRYHEIWCGASRRGVS